MEHAILDSGSFDSPVGTDHDTHCTECHIDSLKVGIADEVADPKIVSRRRVDGSRRSIYHSNRLDELRNSSPNPKTISLNFEKWRAKVSEKSIF